MQLNCVFLPLCPFCVITVPIALISFLFLWVLAKCGIKWAQRSLDWAKHSLLRFWYSIIFRKMECQDKD